MNIKTIYEEKLKELLKKYKEKNEPLAKKGFFLFENIVENSLLYIGINPSDVKDLVNKYNVKVENGIFWGGEKFKDEYPFYQHFNDLANNMKWAHLDLFLTCEKTQKLIEESIDNIFLIEQFKISYEIIKQVSPKIIVVGNAYASRYIQKHFKCVFDNNIGTYRINEFNNIPILFSGMLTGARALDVGSRERLKWHIGFVKNKIMYAPTSSNNTVTAPATTSAAYGLPITLCDI